MRTAIIAAIALLACPALAFDTKQLGQVGSLDLAEIAELIGKAPKLKAEIGRALAEVKKNDEQVKCAGQRFPGPWKELGGTRVAPYLCEFADDKWLSIDADVRLTDKRGHVYDKPTKKAMTGAVNVSESKPRWIWSAKPPDGWSWFTGARQK